MRDIYQLCRSGYVRLYARRGETDVLQKHISPEYDLSRK